MRHAFYLIIIILPAICQGQIVKSFKQDADRIDVTLSEGQLVCKSSNTPRVSWKLTGNLTTFRSPNAQLLDYIVFYGP
jgi:hypothetical protein